MSVEVKQDILTPSFAAQFAATLDRDPFEADVPQGLHLCLCTPDALTADLGPDGHPAGGRGFLPPSPLPRRMWAASDMEFCAPIRVGAAIQRKSTVLDTTEKSGGSGRLLFVYVQHEFSSDGKLLVREKQTLVYREAPAPLASPLERIEYTEPAPDRGQGWDWQRAITPTAPLLFRYSALTFNTHRIHYDYPYVRDVEGYPDIVTHGPLMATLLLDLCDRELGRNRLATFAFRAKSPSFVNEPLLLCGKPNGADIALAILGYDGRTVMEASATIA